MASPAAAGGRHRRCVVPGYCSGRHHRCGVPGRCWGGVLGRILNVMLPLVAPWRIIYCTCNVTVNCTCDDWRLPIQCTGCLCVAHDGPVGDRSDSVIAGCLSAALVFYSGAVWTVCIITIYPDCFTGIVTFLCTVDLCVMYAML